MRKKIEKLVRKLDNRVMYFTENPINFGGYEGFKYFLCWQNTHTVYAAFTSQTECVEFLSDLVNRKTIKIDSREFMVVI